MSVKSKYMAEFRRFSLAADDDNFQSFYDQIRFLHKVGTEDEIVLTYTDPVHGDLLPINNDENFVKAKKSCGGSLLMKVYIHKKDNYIVSNGYGSNQRRSKSKKKQPMISLPADFRPVSAIIDVDILPETLRRVRLHNPGGNKLLGFYIRTGVRLHMTDSQADQVRGISIHRLVPGGLAEMTGLLAVDDEILEVNGIEVAGKSLDQVTDMMIANSSNLVITVRPASSFTSTSAAAAASSTIAADRSAKPSPTLSSSSSRHHRYNPNIVDDETDEVVVHDLAPYPSLSSSLDGKKI